MKAAKKIHTSKKFLSLLLSFLFIPIFIYGGETVRIMPLGDSITYGNSVLNPPDTATSVSYRLHLWEALNNENYAVDFVGSKTGGTDFPPFDPDNEGHPGDTAAGIAADVYQYLTDNPADVILLHIGTNVLRTSPDDVSDALDEIKRYETDTATHVSVILARIINRWVEWTDENGDTRSTEQDKTNTTTFNENLEIMVRDRIANGDDIVVVDMENDTGIIYDATDMHDDLHPIDSGYEKMASLWYSVLTSTLPTHLWKLDEPSGSTAFVDTYRDNDGRCMGAGCPTTVYGQIGGAQLFDGNDEVTVADDGTFDWNGDESFTVEFWVKPTRTDGVNQVVVGRENEIKDNFFWWAGIIGTDGHITFRLRDSDGKQNNLDGPVLNNGDWYHIACVRDGANDENKLYVNGQLSDDSSNIAYAGNFVGTTPVNIGYLTYQGNNTFHLDSAIDELTIYSGAVNTDQVKLHYQNGLNAPKLSITSIPNTFAQVGVSYLYDVESNDPAASYTYMADPDPAWMQIDTDRGEITGTPTVDTVGNIDMAVEAVNSSQTAIQDYVLKVRNPDSLPDGMSHYWKLDESATTTERTYIDSYAGADGTCTGSGCPEPLAGKVNGAQSFTGANIIDIADTASFEWTGDQSFSIEYWIQVDNATAPSQNMVVIGRDGSGNPSYTWWAGIAKDTGHAIFSLRDSDGPTAITVKSNNSILGNNDGYYISIIRDGSSGETRLYVDGVLQNTTPHTYSSDFTDSSTPAVNIGYLNYNGSAGFYLNTGNNSGIDDLVVFNKALIQGEITEHYNNSSAGKSFEELNQPPTADAGPNKTVEVNKPVTITGSGTDPDGTIVSYEWKKGTTVLATTASFDYTPTVVGTDTLTLTVTDDDGEPGTDSMDVIVTEDPPPPPSTLYEAEDAEMSPAFAISSAHSGYTGTGYVDYTGEGYVKWTVELAAEGNYDLVFRYALGSGNRPLHISVDSTSGGSTIDFPATGGWSTWGETRTTVSLTAGTHTIYASTTGLSGANVDHLSIEDATGTPPPNTPPTANAGADKAVQVNNTITITGSGTDPDGTIVSYEWKKGTTVLATTASFDYTPTVVGTDTLTLTVTDDDGEPGTDSMDVIVTEDPPPPPSTLYEAEDAEMSPAFAISSAHSGYTGTGYVDYTGEGYVKWTVELAAEGNYDLVFRYALGSGNRPLHISVDSTSGGSTIDFPATGGWSTWGETRTTVSLTAGTHTIYASTTGLSGANVDHLSIEDATGTPPPNTPPTADAGADKAVQVNNTITITGSGTDPDGTIVSYEWKKGTTVLATTASFDYTPTVVGTDTLTLTVTDDDGEPGTDSMDVIVTEDPPPNIPPTANAGPDKSVQVNQSVTITGSGTDPDGTIASYEWSKDGTVLATTASFDYTPTVVGTDTLTLTVTDDDGEPGTDSMDVIVTEDPPPPPNVLYEAEDAEMSSAFAISSAHSGYTGTGYVDYAGEGYVKWTVELATEGNYDLVFRYALGSGNRPLHISVDSTSGGSTIDFPATGGWSTWGETRTTVSLTAGTHTIYASTTGLSGANVDHLSIEDATGTPPPNTPPTADAGADKAVQVNNTITITGSGTDSDGTVISYEWKKGSTVLASTASFNYTPTTVGTDTLTLTVTDDDGATGTDSMDVVVTAEPAPISEIIVDNLDSEFSIIGTWSESGASDEYAGSSIYS
ncbi:PKD domain-containing protein [Sulfurovum sp. CS9]|uniref:PKD domain-containing protein n=1 Tax=Sulfurovum sp. CS9 TaxID=3391146 RepID=UPI0039ED67C3